MELLAYIRRFGVISSAAQTKECNAAFCWEYIEQRGFIYDENGRRCPLGDDVVT